MKMKLFSDSKREPYDTRWMISFFMGIVGTGLLLYGINYNLSHIDNFNEIQYSAVKGGTLYVGYALLMLIPVVLKRWILALIVVGGSAVLWGGLLGR